jgi:hypothetical protein
MLSIQQAPGATAAPARPGRIKGNDTLLFVVDIIDALQAGS